MWRYLLVVAFFGSWGAWGQASREVHSGLEEDGAIAALLEPYRAQLAATMGEELVETSAPLVREQPSSKLSNLVADALLWKAKELFGDSVDIAVTNFGGIRTSLGVGPVTVGRVFELSPFDNTIVRMEFSGSEVLALADEIAKVNGEPVSGMSLVIQADQTAGDVRVGGEPVDLHGVYGVVTINYLAEGNGRLPSLWKMERGQVADAYQRDALLDYFRYLGKSGVVIDSQFEPRVRNVE